MLMGSARVSPYLNETGFKSEQREIVTLTPKLGYVSKHTRTIPGDVMQAARSLLFHSFLIRP